MNKLFPAVLLFFSSQCLAQDIMVKFYNKGEDTLYSLYYNKIKISGYGNCAEINCISADAEIKKEGCIFYIRPKVSDTWIHLTFVNNNDSISGDYYVTSRVPSPYAYIRHSHVSMRYYLDTIYARAPYDDKYNKSLRFEVVAFTGEIMKDGNMYYREYHRGNAFSTVFKEKCLKVRKDSLILKNIVIKAPDNSTYIIPRHSYLGSMAW